MGFGYLLIGYLITYLLHLTFQAFGVGGLALLVGYGTMMLGLWELNRYHTAFAIAKWTCVPLLSVAIYRILCEFDKLLYWSLPVFTERVETGAVWVQFVLNLFFQFAMLYGIREIVREVGLQKFETAALRNSIFVGLYGLMYILTNLILVGNPQVRSYFVFSMILTQLVYILINLVLLISCTKNICAEGQEDVPPKRHRWELLNKIDRVYDSTRQKNIDNARAAGEAFAERRRQKKENKRSKKH